MNKDSSVLLLTCTYSSVINLNVCACYGLDNQANLVTTRIAKLYGAESL